MPKNKKHFWAEKMENLRSLEPQAKISHSYKKKSVSELTETCKMNFDSTSASN